MPEITSFADARERLGALYEADGALLDDYAHIAFFLSTEASFTAALTDVSASLWQYYCDFGPANHNRFTSAIAVLGRRYGFMYDESNRCSTNVVTLLGAVDGARYLQWVKSGIFFKDDMDAKHGEHSHTLQWLAVAIAREKHGLQISSTAGHLYRSIYNVKARKAQRIIVPGFKLKPKKSAQEARGDVSLWSWLVDCFPLSMAANQAPPDAESLFTDRFRCPQNLMEYLFNAAGEDHFVATYLRYRYLRRRWINEYSDNYDRISGGSTSKTYMSTKLEKSAQSPHARLTAIQGDDGKPSAYTRALGGGRVVVKHSATDPDFESRNKRNYWDVTFHGRAGQLRDPTQYA